MSIFTDMHLDPDKTGVTLEELSHRANLGKIRESLCKKGWTIERYYSHEGGEIVEYRKYKKIGPMKVTRKSYKMTIQINKDYTWEIK